MWRKSLCACACANQCHMFKSMWLLIISCWTRDFNLHTNKRRYWFRSAVPSRWNWSKNFGIMHISRDQWILLYKQMQFLLQCKNMTLLFLSLWRRLHIGPEIKIPGPNDAEIKKNAPHLHNVDGKSSCHTLAAKPTKKKIGKMSYFSKRGAFYQIYKYNE